MSKFFEAFPVITPHDYKLKKILWENHLTGEKRVIYRYFNGYDHGLLKRQKHDQYWSSILENCQEVKKQIEERGGLFYYNFHLLPDDRSSNYGENYPVLRKPTALRTVFVSGFLFPQQKIRSINGGFYISGQKSPSLDLLIKRYIRHYRFPLVLFNLGYYYTNILLNEKEFGYNQIRQNLGLKKEVLSSSYLSFLDASAWSEKEKLVINPPLFNKGTILFGKDNKILINKNWSLKEGKLQLLGVTINWSRDAVNSNDQSKDVAIFTPFINNENFSNCVSWKDFKLFVGKDRVNLLILSKGIGDNPKSYLVKIKKDEILMPPMGIIVSLKREYFEKKFGFLQNSFDEDGYVNYDSDRPARVGKQAEFQLEIPGIDRNDLSFLYGGFLPLVMNGNDLTETPKKLEKVMWQQGFSHPFSRQSQETPIEKPYRREPRAVLVITENKSGEEEYGYFCFSGRYEESIGVTIFEITKLLKQILSKGRMIKNVIHLDSGSAVKLMYLKSARDVRILNLTALSMRSFTGEYGENVYNLIGFSV